MRDQSSSKLLIIFLESLSIKVNIIAITHAPYSIKKVYKILKLKVLFMHVLILPKTLRK